MAINSVEKKSQYDLLVIGAGVFGAMMALEASQRGLKVILLEKNDFGSGTSANSLKTIHGGLRYLQSLDISSSIISAKERKAWLAIAPGLVRPLPCILPTTKELMKSKLVVGAGVMLYNALTFGRNVGMPQHALIPNAHLISLSSLNQQLPKLADVSVTGGACWYDAQAVNTERLVLACVLAAEQAGARVENYQTLDQLSQDEHGYVSRLAGSNEELRSRFVVDCSGRGCYLESQYLGHLSSSEFVFPIYVKAVNLVMKKKLSTYAFGIKAKDSSGMTRLLFTAPWQNTPSGDDFTLIGTWYFTSECQTQESLSDVELKQCIEQINSAFEAPICTEEDVVQVHVGYLPADPSIVKASGPDAGLIKHACFNSWGELDVKYEGLYSLKGTKFTLARKAAEEAVAALQKKHNLTLEASISATVSLWREDQVAEKRLNLLDITESQLQFVRTYFPMGIEKITELCEKDPEMSLGVPGAEYCCRAVFEYCFQNEFVRHLTDLLIRRVPIGAGELPCAKTSRYALDFLANKLLWDSARQLDELAALEAYYMKRES